VAQLNAIELDAVAEQQVIQGASAAFAQVTAYVGRFCRVPLTENAA
jgi:heme oxygenase